MRRFGLVAICPFTCITALLMAATSPVVVAGFPSLAQYDEAFGTGEITPALRFTAQRQNGYMWPSSLAASEVSKEPCGPEFTRFFADADLRADTADNGCPHDTTGTMDSRRDNSTIVTEFGSLTANDFEVIRLG